MILYQANPEIVYRPEGRDGAILFDPDSSAVQVLNLTGAFIWERLDGTRTLESIGDELATAFDEVPGDATVVAAEVEAFVRALVQLGFAAPATPVGATP
jgi:hypothetical protein